jgi:4-hydroxy-3-methylbut-2-en-1-yl diphosphate reductase
MRIEKARELGFCFGVRRALRIIEDSASKNVKIATLGPIVHNEMVVERIKSLGVEVVDDARDVRGGTVAISSHGVSPAVREIIEAQGAVVIDTTCPIVRSAQKAAQRLATAGYGVVIFGEATHPEVRGLLGWAGQNAIASMDASAIRSDSLPSRVGILAQTTQSEPEFVAFANRLTDRLLAQAREIRIVNTLCRETQKRQLAAEELASASDVMIVVGGRNSSNTRRLAEVCSPLVQTYHIANAEELDESWLLGRSRVGLTAGASTPDEAIEEVMMRVESIVKPGTTPASG